MIAPNCPFCGKQATEVKTQLRYQRGDRVLLVESIQWQCPDLCLGVDGEKPYTFANFKTMVLNEAKAQKEWKAHFKERMPPPERKMI